MNGSKSSKRFLESPRHPIVQELRRLLEKPAERRAQGRFVVEGRRIIEDAANAGLRIEVLLVGSRLAEDSAAQALIDRVEAAGGRVVLCGERIIRALSQTETPQGLIAAVSGWKPHRPEAAHLRPPVLLLDGVQDPGNVGTIIRTAAGAGAGAVVLGEACADLFNPKVIRASAGAVFRVPAVRLADASGLLDVAAAIRNRGWALLGLDPHRGRPYYDEALVGDVAFVVGGEARGITEKLAKQCTGFLQIPLAGGVESLNVAASVAVVLFEAARQRARDAGR